MGFIEKVLAHVGMRDIRLLRLHQFFLLFSLPPLFHQYQVLIFRFVMFNSWLFFDGVCFDSTVDFLLDASSNKEDRVDGRALPFLICAPSLSVLASTCVRLTRVGSRSSRAVGTMAQARLSGSIPC